MKEGGKMNSSLKALTSFAISLISTALIFKQFNLPGWETTALLGGSILYFVIVVIIGVAFDLALIPSLVFSALITGFIMLFVTPVFGIFLVLFGFSGLFLFLAYESEEARYG
jgi:hypothetical protein